MKQTLNLHIKKGSQIPGNVDLEQSINSIDTFLCKLLQFK